MSKVHLVVVAAALAVSSCNDGGGKNIPTGMAASSEGLARYDGEAPPMDAGVGLDAIPSTGGCTLLELLAYKVKMYELSWRAATSNRFHFAETRVQLLFDTDLTLREMLVKGERAYLDARRSGACSGKND